MPYKDREKQRAYQKKWDAQPCVKKRRAAQKRLWRATSARRGCNFDPNKPTALLSRLIIESKYRAKRRGQEHTLTLEWALGVYQKTCSVSGLDYHPGSLPGIPGARVPSIDRIDSSKGYTPDNCRLVCFQVNIAMGAFDDAAFFEMCEGVYLTGLGGGNEPASTHCP